MKDKVLLRGYVLAILGAIFWGFSGTAGQYLLNNKNLNPLLISNVRLFFGGIILIVISIGKNKKKSFEIFKNKKDVLILFIFALLGIVWTQFTYFQTIKSTNAPTATVFLFLSSIFIVIGTCFKEKRLPYKEEIIAIFFALLGTFVLATHFNLSKLIISPIGLFWGFSAALATVVYTVLPINLIKKYSTIVTIGFAMFIGGISITIVLRPWTLNVSYDSMTILSLAAMVIFGTVLSFSCFLEGVSIIGPIKGSLITGLEAIASLIFSMLLLGDRFALIDILGMFFIIFGISVLSLKDLRKSNYVNKKRSSN